MKAIFFVIASACLINGLNANFAGFPLEDEENFESELSPQLDIFYPENGDAENLIAPFPTGRPTRPPRPTTTSTPAPTTTTTTTTLRPTRPTRPPRPTTTRPSTTTTSRPTTTARPTRPPRPTRGPNPPLAPRPELERIQIYRNAFRSMGPLAGRLNNIVLNRGRSQRTAQENEILYNLRALRANGVYNDDEDEY